MRYLGLALFAEGPTDYRFLPPVLRRTTEELCSMEGRTTVAISEEVLKLNLYLPQEYRDADLATKILEAAKAAEGAYNILFIHTDGAGNPEDAYNQRVQPAKERVQLSRLRQVPAFGRFEQELRTALVELNYLSQGTS